VRCPLGETRLESSLSCVFTICYAKNKGFRLRLVTFSNILRAEGYERLPDCRNPLNAHVGTQYFRDQDGAIHLLIILNNRNPSTAHRQS
jgi:hypothetical protein